MARLIARAAGRSLGLDGRAILLGLGREAQRRYRSRSSAPLELAPAASITPGRLVRVAYAAWLCGLATFALVVVQVDRFLPAGRAVAVFQLAAGMILLVEGLGLVVERFPFRRLLSARLAGSQPSTGGRLRHAGRTRFVGAALTLLGIVWIGVGVLDLVRGARTLL